MNAPGPSSSHESEQSPMDNDLDRFDTECFDSRLSASDGLDSVSSQTFGTANELLQSPMTGSSRLSNQPTNYTSDTAPPFDSACIQPPAKLSATRKRKAPTKREEDFEHVKPYIMELYYDKKETLQKTKEVIKEKFGFDATDRQFKRHLKKWGSVKNIGGKEMNFIALKDEERKQNEPYKRRRVFKLKGRMVSPKNIERFKKRSGFTADCLQTLDSIPATPDGLSYRTEPNSVVASPKEWIKMSTPLTSPRISPLCPALSESTLDIPKSTSLQDQRPNPGFKDMNDPLRTPISGTSVLEQGSLISYQPEVPPDSLLDRISTPVLFSPKSSVNSLGHQIIQKPISSHLLPAVHRYRESEEEPLRNKLSNLETELDKNHPSLVGVLIKLGLIFMEQGRYISAEDLFRRAACISQHHFKDSDPRTLKGVMLMTTARLQQGRLSGIQEILQATFIRIKKSPGSQHSDILAKVNLAWTYQIRGRWRDAETVEMQVMGLSENILGPYHPVTLKSLHSLSCLKSSLGKYQEAEEMSRLALDRRMEHLGHDHPDTLASAGNRARILSLIGQYERAEQLSRQALKESEKKLGYYHPKTIYIAESLFIVLGYRKEVEESIAIAERMVRGREEALGSTHPSTLRSLDNLACVYKDQERYEDAERLQRQVSEIYEKTLGPNHPDTLLSISNLAWSLYKQEKYEDAEIFGRLVLVGREKELGSNHPDTLRSASHLSMVLCDQGKYEVAELMERRALEGREKQLGSNHPDTLESISCLAWVLLGQGKYEAAEKMERRALEGRVKALGPNHPDTLQSITNLAWVLRQQEKYEAAEKMERRALLIERKEASAQPLGYS